MKLGNFIPLLCMLLGFVESDDTVESDCNYDLTLDEEINHYVYNPDYPDYYLGEHNCRWKARSNGRIKLNCSLFDIPPTTNCSMDYMKVDVGDDIQHVFCGLNSFVVESISSEMTVTFHSRNNTYGGRFICEITAIENECRCGWKNPSRIVGGVETGVNEYPMMAGLIDFDNYLLFCGATIITPRHVVTAAHCVENLDVSSLGIVVGEHDVTTGRDTNATQIHFAADIIVHPQYQPRQDDIAIVKSQTKFVYSMRVGPACLPFYYMQRNFTDQLVTELSWGSTIFAGPKSDVLMKVDLRIITTKQCSESYSNVTSNKLCTFSKEKHSCQFDSGGPVLWQNLRTNRVFDLGIISYGATCADNKPGVSTRITKYLDFIVQSTRGETYCHVY